MASRAASATAPIIAATFVRCRGRCRAASAIGSDNQTRYRRRAGASSRSKRDEILRTATAYFGEYGYEATKLADVAAAVGIGSTALYHYFESKLHCLYVIMADALGFFRSEFDLHTSAHEDYIDALLAVLRASYDLSDQDVLRNRVLVAEQGLVGVSQDLSARGGGPRARARADPRRRVHVGDVPRPRHGAGHPARGRSRVC